MKRRELASTGCVLHGSESSESDRDIRKRYVMIAIKQEAVTGNSCTNLAAYWLQDQLAQMGIQRTTFYTAMTVVQQ